MAALGPRALGVFVVLGDQPLLDVDGLKQLARQDLRNPPNFFGDHLAFQINSHELVYIFRAESERRA